MDEAGEAEHLDASPRADLIQIKQHLHYGLAMQSTSTAVLWPPRERYGRVLSTEVDGIQTIRGSPEMVTERLRTAIEWLRSIDVDSSSFPTSEGIARMLL